MSYPCDPCSCPEAYYRDSQSWRKAVILLLCRAIGVSSVQASGASGTLAFGAVSGAYATLVTNVVSRSLVSIYNTLDKAVYVSLDGGTTDGWIVPPTTGYLTLNLKAAGIVTSLDIKVKAIGGNPGSGNIYGAVD